MFKLFRKKLTKKGFTLAELLVVVAIIAILVAIAIPVFTGSLKDAQYRVNQANIRSVRAAGTTAILTHWNEFGADGQKISAGAATGWFAIADVNENGDISNLSIVQAKSDEANNTGITECKDAVQTSSIPASNLKKATPEDSNNDFRNTAAPYTVQVYIIDVSTAEATS